MYTNIIAYAINKRPKLVLRRLMEHLCISAITMTKLEYGVCYNLREFQRVDRLRLENWA